MISDDDTLDQSSPARQVKGPGAGSLLETVPSSSSETIEERPPVDPLERTASRQPHMGVVGEAPESLARIGRYAVLRVLGAGAMGVVLSAFDEELNRRVAVKILKSTESSGRERMVREAQAMARLSHPNVVQVYEVGEHNDQLFLVMEYIEGTDIRRYCDSKRLSVSQRVQMIVKVLDILKFAHSRLIIHRDLKPANIMIGPHGEVHVMDWGLARVRDPWPRSEHANRGQGEPSPTHSSDPVASSRQTERADSPESPWLTQAGSVVGTPAYMSPEQASGDLEAIGPATDIYALGALLYELLAGHPPYRPEATTTPIEIVHRVLRGLDGTFDLAEFNNRFAGCCNGIDPEGGYARMRGPSRDLNTPTPRPLVCVDHRHIGWLTDHHHTWLDELITHFSDHRAHAGAADFLVIGKHNMDRCLQISLLVVWHLRHHAR